MRVQFLCGGGVRIAIQEGLTLARPMVKEQAAEVRVIARWVPGDVEVARLAAGFGEACAPIQVVAGLTR